MCMSWYPKRSEESVGSSETGYTDDCEPVLRTEPGSLEMEQEFVAAEVSTIYYVK